jgi:hypothetical protein
MINTSIKEDIAVNCMAITLSNMSTNLASKEISSIYKDFCPKNKYYDLKNLMKNPKSVEWNSKYLGYFLYSYCITSSKNYMKDERYMLYLLKTLDSDSKILLTAKRIESYLPLFEGLGLDPLQRSKLLFFSILLLEKSKKYGLDFLEKIKHHIKRVLFLIKPNHWKFSETEFLLKMFIIKYYNFNLNDKDIKKYMLIILSNENALAAYGGGGIYVGYENSVHSCLSKTMFVTFCRNLNKIYLSLLVNYLANKVNSFNGYLFQQSLAGALFIHDSDDFILRSNTSVYVSKVFLALLHFKDSHLLCLTNNDFLKNKGAKAYFSMVNHDIDFIYNADFSHALSDLSVEL